jgi:hypothetical protein
MTVAWYPKKESIYIFIKVNVHIFKGSFRKESALNSSKEQREKS